MRRFIFFVKSFNDIDHITPLVDYICGSTEYEAELFCNVCSYNFAENHNIKYLKRVYGLEVNPIWGGKEASFVERKMFSLIAFLESLNASWKKYLPHTFFIKVALVNFLYRNLPGWRNRFFENKKPDILVFDSTSPSQPQHLYIVRAAQKNNIPVFCVPHGLIIYTNKYINNHRNLIKGKKLVFFDKYIFSGEQTKFLTDRGVQPEKIVEIGSARYCPEWMKIYQEKVAPEKFSFSSSKENLKVVIFLSQEIYNVNSRLLQDTITELARLKYIDLVIKPHTRGMTRAYLSSIANGGNIKICDEVSSVALCDWADVGIVYGSSIAIQVLYAKKILIYPSYIDSNTTLFADLGAACIVSSLDELESELEMIHKNRSYSPYDQERVTEFMNRIIYAGKKYRDVRADILKYMVNFSG